jgi:hypothetical protein
VTVGVSSALRARGMLDWIEPSPRPHDLDLNPFENGRLEGVRGAFGIFELVAIDTASGVGRGAVEGRMGEPLALTECGPPLLARLELGRCGILEGFAGDGSGGTMLPSVCGCGCDCGCGVSTMRVVVAKGCARLKCWENSFVYFCLRNATSMRDACAPSG